ncbi:hypothetical protein [Roseateles sp.]|uniref:DUF6928 family protein n=1 Tax=Roseateles sp. TaxID=1971397 RepID=UPI0025EFEEA8|nr:hypothetical protein [Roseateles sp.]MBV8035012.1 hypothetical protein [Roseateles sp.]
MGAKTWMLVYAAGCAREALAAAPVLDRQATQAWLARLFPGETLLAQDDGDLGYTHPPDDQIFAGCFGDGLAVVAAGEFGLDRPSMLDERFLLAAEGRRVHLHAMHSVADWFAFAVWDDRRLLRSLSLSPDSGFMENIGEPLDFERPFWNGERPADDPQTLAAGEKPYPLPFHPLDLGEAALQALFGYQLEGDIDASLLEPESIPLMHFRRRRKSWFRLR